MKNKILIFTMQQATKDDYEKIGAKVKSISNSYAKISDTTYLIKTERSSVNIREIIKEIKTHGKIQKIFVSNWGHPSAWTGLAPEITDWIRNN